MLFLPHIWTIDSYDLRGPLRQAVEDRILEKEQQYGYSAIATVRRKLARSLPVRLAPGYVAVLSRWTDPAGSALQEGFRIDVSRSDGCQAPFLYADGRPQAEKADQDDCRLIAAPGWVYSSPDYPADVARLLVPAGLVAKAEWDPVPPNVLYGIVLDLLSRIVVGP